MKRNTSALRAICSLLACTMLFSGLHISIAHAKMVSTGEVINQAQEDMSREQILERLGESQAEQTLIEWGVDPDLVKTRVAAMTAEELAEFNANLQEMPAGGTSVVGVVVLIFVVLIVLDLLGATNIFPVIRPINYH